MSGRELADLTLTGVVDAWAPRWVGVALYLVPFGGALTILGAGLPRRWSRLVVGGAAVAASAMILIVNLALGQAPPVHGGWGATVGLWAVLCWAAAAVLALRAHRIARPGSPSFTVTSARLAVLALVAAVAVGIGAPANAAPERVQDIECSSLPKDTTSQTTLIPVAVVAAAGFDQYDEIDELLGGYNAVGRFVQAGVSSQDRPAGWDDLPVDEPEATLNELLSSTPMVVVPLGVWKPGELVAIRGSTLPLVAVAAAPVLDPRDLEPVVVETYRNKLASSPPGLEELSLTVTIEGQIIELAANTLPGEIATMNSVTLRDSRTNASESCSLRAALALPARVEVPEGSDPMDIVVSGSLSTYVDNEPARSVPGLEAQAEETTATTTTTGGTQAGEPAESDRGRSTDPAEESRGGGLSPWFLVLAAVVAGGTGLAIGRANRSAVATDPPEWPATGPEAMPVAVAPIGEPGPALDHRPHRSVSGWTTAVRSGGDVRIQDLGVSPLAPIDTEAGRVWAHGSDSAVGIACWLEKKAGLGEDAEPTLRMHTSGQGLIGVYDGTGGSGAAIARTLRDGTELTGAYVASRLSREIAETWHADLVGDGSSPGASTGLDTVLASALHEEGGRLAPTGAVKGSLHRVLPTTLAAVAYEPHGSDEVLATALWAGDSRAYVLSSDSGLQVLTVDDTRETDALELIKNDQPMTNLVSADRPFTINQQRYRCLRPALLVTATDGCYGYVRTPAHFEYLLLRTLMDAGDLAAWGDRFLGSLQSFTADDASLSAVGFGFASFGAIQAALKPRFDYLHAEHWLPFSEATPAEAEALAAASWAGYQGLYHARILAPTEFP